jgi:Leucine-rich repeat (LRR) protein
LIKLLELNLSGNQFTFLPAEIGLLENLTLFDLSGNQLVDLPDEFPDMFRYNITLTIEHYNTQYHREHSTQ